MTAIAFGPLIAQGKSSEPADAVTEKQAWSRETDDRREKAPIVSVPPALADQERRCVEFVSLIGRMVRDALGYDARTDARDVGMAA